MDTHPIVAGYTVRPHANDSQAFHALGSQARLDILRELAIGARNVPELAKTTGLRPGVIRYHLGVLLQDGLVEHVQTGHEGRVGRPTNRYRLRSQPAIDGFPPRRYETLSEILLAVVTTSLGRNDWTQALYRAGRESGRNLIAAIQRGAGIQEWTPLQFVQRCVEGYMPGMGMRTQVVESRGDRVQYRTFTCPFQELATKYPDPVCDSLDAGFHDGIAEGLGTNVENRRLACLGHGDPYCEYALQWKRDRSEEGLP